MNIIIIGANGKLGKLLTDEAINRGHNVTAVIRSGKSSNQKAKTLVKDLFNLTKEDFHNQDIVINAFGNFVPETLYLHGTSLDHITNLLIGSTTRLIVAGSAGSLFVDNESKTILLDSPKMPDIYKPLSTAMTNAFYELRKHSDVKWTYFSPTLIFDPDGIRTGEYKLGKDHLMVNSKGESYVSYADAAIAMIDEVEEKKHINKRFTISSL